jgi:hypothetical protein
MEHGTIVRVNKLADNLVLGVYRGTHKYQIAHYR